MLRYIIWMLVSMIIFSCTRKKQDATVPLPAPIPISQTVDSTAVPGDSHFFWGVDLESEENLHMKKMFAISKDSLSAENMVNRLNKEYPEVQIRYRYVSHDTIFLKIDKSVYLTQQMGSTGAEAYLATVTYNMTELNGINAVDINFKMGDHAEPGVYTRTDFVHETKNKE
jgi:hypothetical protein